MIFLNLGDGSGFALLNVQPYGIKNWRHSICSNICYTSGPSSVTVGHGLLLTSAWCSSFCCRTSITSSARRIVSSSFLAGVTNRPTFSAVQELELKWSEIGEAQCKANSLAG